MEREKGKVRLEEVSDIDMNLNGTFNSMFTKKMFSEGTLIKHICYERTTSSDKTLGDDMHFLRACGYILCI